MSDIRAARGAARLCAVDALPFIDGGASVGYEGSISKTGDNADWDWGMYQDERGEWVLVELDGPGCLFNFTQHRYPTSEVPVFRFYFDGEDEPRFALTPAEFGKKPPFLSPLADIFVGPEAGGAGPIWVVRSFVPMPFTTHVKVTSSIRLEGNSKALGQGGWGHVTYQLYDTADGIGTFDPAADISAAAAAVAAMTDTPPADPAALTPLTLPPGGSAVVWQHDGADTVGALSLLLETFSPQMLSGLWLRLTFDDADAPQVEAPIGTFFGCEYGCSPAVLRTALLTADIPAAGGTARFSHRFPMPFFRCARLEVCSRLNVPVRAAVGVTITGRVYPQKGTGYFRSSPYYPPTPNTPGKNSVIADVAGHGHMVYGVLTGTDIRCAGCEGDVRVFIDGMASPIVESDGSESWASYGWGFVCPPQSNPFSAYNGAFGRDSDWSELRLTYTDSYPFRARLRFELEHGCQNDGGGLHSGQIFYYGAPQPDIRPVAELTPGCPQWQAAGEPFPVHDRFENGIHEHWQDFTCLRGAEESTLTVPLPANNAGLLLHRVSLQDRSPARAAVFVDGRRVTERDWLFADGNTVYRLLEDAFFIPAHYTAGKTAVTVKICPADGNWSACRYRAFAKLPE